MTPPNTDVAAAQDWARDWLLDHALPLWWNEGADREGGGFFELIDQQGHAVKAQPKRIRVQGRQMFVYAEAGRLGWDGPWREAVAHGQAELFARYRRDDGLYRRFPTAQGPADDDFDLYDQAFVMLGLASSYQATGGAAEPRAAAEALFATLQSRLGHRLAGFNENFTGKLPLRSNPHMHMLEALLAWIEQVELPGFRAKAEEIVALALGHMIDPATGAIAEYFDADWQRLPGKDDVREPGHQFEWAYLLTHAARILGGNHDDAAARLVAFGTAHGIDRAREVAIFSLDGAGEPTDRDARLWAQSERLRTALLVGPGVQGGVLPDEAAHALATLRRYCDVPVTGLWLDRLRPDDTFVDQPAPASSFYHIVTSLIPLLAAPRG